MGLVEYPEELNSLEMVSMTVWGVPKVFGIGKGIR